MKIELKWVQTSILIPKSAKIMPCWVHTPNDGIELAYLTDNEKYFVSIDHKRVYHINEIDKWTIVDLPLDMYGI